MYLVHYRSDKGNFGDDLNEWLWPQIFTKNIFTKNDDISFWGIGSILMQEDYAEGYFNRALQNQHQLVLGTGVRSLKEELVINENWDVVFLRGPLSSYKLLGNFSNYITDSAYFITLLDQYKKYIVLPKKYKVSIIPYYGSTDNLDWEQLAELHNLNIIYPTGNNVEQFIKEVAQSEFVLSEAMHGCMMADIMRVPWKRIKFNAHKLEGEVVSEFKWHDWYASINLNNITPIVLEEKTVKIKNKIFKRSYEMKNMKNISKQLSSYNSSPYYLSSDDRFNEIVSELKDVKQKVIEKYFTDL